MRSMKLVAVAAIAVVALMAASASSAFAAGPTFHVAGALFTGNETIEAAATTAQVLKASNIELECPNVAVAAGAEIHGTEPGTDGETLVYSGCHQKGNAACEARTKGGGTAEQIQTVALKSELVYATKEGSEKASGGVDTLFKPSTGSTFVEVEMKGTGCPSLTEAKITGSVATENGAEAVEPTLNAPAAPITSVYHSGGTKVSVSLKAFGFVEAAYVGTVKIKMSGTNKGKEFGTHP
jgi:hypothetical protein